MRVSMLSGTAAQKQSAPNIRQNLLFVLFNKPLKYRLSKAKSLQNTRAGHISLVADYTSATTSTQLLLFARLSFARFLPVFWVR